MKENSDVSNAQEQAIKESTNILKKVLKNNLKKIILYGSYARGDYNQLSDIDIFVLVKNKKSELNNILNKICEELFELDIKYNVTINPLIENVQVFDEYKEVSLLFENIEKEGVVLYG